jgi:hypothetical protein
LSAHSWKWEVVFRHEYVIALEGYYTFKLETKNEGKEWAMLNQREFLCLYGKDEKI